MNDEVRILVAVTLLVLVALLVIYERMLQDLDKFRDLLAQVRYDLDLAANQLSVISNSAWQLEVRVNDLGKSLGYEYNPAKTLVTQAGWVPVVQEKPAQPT